MRKLVLLAGAAICVAAPAFAQSGIEGRVGRLESEMRAVQRKVFPGNGMAPSIEPQITATPQQGREIGSPATAPLADLTQRVNLLEQQVTNLTGQVEQTQYRMRQLEEQFAAYRKETDAKLATGGGAAPAAAGGIGGGEEPGTAPPAARKPTTPAPPAQAGKDPARAGRVAAIEKPNTAQPDEDDYIYGYRLWSAKLYPEAVTQLKKVVADYPRSRRASYAQYLIGRAYLDDGKPSLASIAFYDNYKKMPDGERAPESLYYLGQSLQKLDKPADACKVYGELSDVYGAKIDAQMRGNIERARVAAKCK